MFTPDTPRTHRAAPARRAARRGFTLVEILTVVLILGIASAIIAPQVGSRSDLKARAAARVLIADLLYAQNMAVAQQQPYYVKFDADAEEYRVLSGAGPAAGADVLINNPVSKEPFVVKMGPGGNSRLSDVRIKSAVFNGEDSTFLNQFTVSFDELGQPFVYSYVNDDKNPLFDGTVVIQCGQHEIAVTIERYTGEIKVQ